MERRSAQTRSDLISASAANRSLYHVVDKGLPGHCDPGILASGHGIRRAHFGEGVGDSERDEADGEPGVDHHGWTAALDADDQDAAERGPARDDAEGEADHADEAERAVEF